MNRKEYLKPKAHLIPVAAEVFAADIPTTGPSDERSPIKRNGDWDYNRDFYDDDCDW